MAQTAAVMGLSATGPQDKYVFDEKNNPLRPNIRQYTHFTKFHRTTYPQVSQFVGQVVEFIFKPNELGDLWHNAYLALTLPQLPVVSGQTYGWSPQIGRAIIEHIEFRIGNQIIEKIDDYWYTIRDQLFLDADSKLAMYQATNGGQNDTQSCPSTLPVDLMIPLELFFCRRHTFTDARRDLLERPPLPVCALKEFISIKFFFRPQSWFTNYPSPVEFSNVRMVTEEILLTDEERIYYQTKPHTIIINQAVNNPVLPFINGNVTQNFSANFPVLMMVWFVCNSSTAYNTRYTYGYPASSTTSVLNFFNGVTVNYVDQLTSSQIFINNRDITGRFGTGPFYQLKQPMDHDMSVPTNGIYTYCFGNTPTTYNQGGYLDFEKIDNQSSKINLTFNSAIIPTIANSYNFFMYFYGYQVLQIANGRVSLVYK
jgi:hypothetical protein